MTHELKTWPEFFDPLLKGEKRFELRKEDDARVFRAGDTLRLREWSQGTGYTGRERIMDVTYVLRGPCFGLERGHICMSLAFSNSTGEVRRNAVTSTGLLGLPGSGE